MAKRLTATGVSVTVYTDAALMSHIVDADAVWIGGDALDDKGLVNKIGSLALAIMAKTLDIRFISFMGSDKLLSKDMNQFFHFLTQNPREVAMDYADELVVVNEYYEHIPLELVENVFTEKGLFRPADLLESCRQEKASELFKELARDSG
jgi:translation initiation factor 2B subunit (eIF-2B alpha/beta/delta family)